MLRALVLVIALAGIFASSALAQERQKIGLLIATPGLVGVDWEITPRFAVRSDFAFARIRATGAPGFGAFDRNRSAAAGVSAVIYVRNLSPLRVYVSPRYAHQLSRSSGDFSSTQTQSTISGSVGARFDLAPRFGLFADAGLSYAHWRLTAGGTSGVSTNTSLANTASIGAMLFF